MNNYPNYAQTKNNKYKINTDYRVAIRCDEIARDNTIQDEEKTLAILYILFGEKALDNSKDWKELVKIAIKYLACGKEINTNQNKEECDMSIKQDWGYIQASFFSDYNINLSTIQMHWWQFYDLLNGLTDDCILNRVRYIRNFDISQIKDSKERARWIKQKEQVSLKAKIKVEKTLEQKRLDRLFEEQLKGG